MKKTTKALLSTSLVLFIAGALLALSAMLFIKFNDIDMFGVKSPNVNIQTKRVEIKEILGYSPDSNYVLGISQKKFNTVEASLYAGSIEIKYTDESEPFIEYSEVNTENIEIRIVEDTIIINEKDMVGHYGIFVDSNGISFKGIRQLFGPGMSASANQKITVNIPRDYPVTKLSSKTEFGDLAVDSISCKDCDLNTTFGNISVNGVRVDGGKLFASGTKSNVTIIDTYYTAGTVKTKFGDISIAIPEAPVCNTTAESWFGNVNIVSASPDSFRLMLKTNLGTVTKDSESFGMILETNTESTSRISVNVIGGNIDVSKEMKS